MFGNALVGILYQMPERLRESRARRSLDGTELYLSLLLLIVDSDLWTEAGKMEPGRADPDHVLNYHQLDTPLLAIVLYYTCVDRDLHHEMRGGNIAKHSKRLNI